MEAKEQITISQVTCYVHSAVLSYTEEVWQQNRAQCKAENKLSLRYKKLIKTGKIAATAIIKNC